ncbi:hypothetical protein JCM8547_008998 [Rhodosporidiobolus lusitaniae]
MVRIVLPILALGVGALASGNWRRDAESDLSSAADGMQALTTEWAEGYSAGNTTCDADCNDFTTDIAECDSAGSTAQLIQCACVSDLTAEMVTCGTCMGGENPSRATTWQSACNTYSGLISSVAAGKTTLVGSGTLASASATTTATTTATGSAASASATDDAEGGAASLAKSATAVLLAGVLGVMAL